MERGEKEGKRVERRGRGRKGGLERGDKDK